MSYICFNPLCKHHLPLSEKDEDAHTIWVPGDDYYVKEVYGITGAVIGHVPVGMKAINRFDHNTAVGDEFWFCESCENALKAIAPSELKKDRLCANVVCDYHNITISHHSVSKIAIPKSTGSLSISATHQLSDMLGVVHIHRHKYMASFISDYGSSPDLQQTDYYLCDVCHGAHEFRASLRDWNGKHVYKNP